MKQITKLKFIKSSRPEGRRHETLVINSATVTLLTGEQSEVMSRRVTSWKSCVTDDQ